MAIDRTWWNNLVDDDGSGLKGTVWNKATIKGLLDAIDAMPTGLSSGTFSIIMNTPAGGEGIYTTRAGIWAKVGNLVYCGGRLQLSSKGSMTGNVNLGGFPYPCSGLAQQSMFVVPYFGGLNAANPVSMIGGYMTPGTQHVTMQCVGANGGNSVIPFAAEYFNALDIFFGCVYVS